MAGDNNYSLGPVPNTARKGVASLTMVMLGLTFFSASMWTGGSLGTGLSFNDFFLAVLIGNLILGIYTSFLGYIGASTGLSTTFLLVSLLVLKALGFLLLFLAVLKLGGLELVSRCLRFRCTKQRASIPIL